jgi:phosphoglucomutase
MIFLELDALVKQRFQHWTENEYFDQQTKDELLQIIDPKEIEDRFYTELEFGTGGMRGVLGAGTNRMNKYIIRKVTQGLAEVMLEQDPANAQKGVVIAYDSRRYSAEFALETALVLAANGIKAYLFESLRPTPELSFAVRYLQTSAGVNITASHNPKDYNGYKVYWEDGGQIPPQLAKLIVAKVTNQDWTAQPLGLEEAKAKGLLETVGEQVDRAYFEQIKKQLLFPELAKIFGRDFKIVFTPLHGTGGRPVLSLLKEIGFTSVYIVSEQAEPDPEFPTVLSPNPEDPAAFELALQYAQDKQADIILATDPDADRLGLYAKDQNGEFRRFTGNQIGVLLEYYLLSQKKKAGCLAENSVIVKTVASTDLGEAIATDFGAQTLNVLVGFKYIGEQIKIMEQNRSGVYVFGFEESHGYLAGTYARDKDAVQAAALLAEAALYYRTKEGLTLPEVLEKIFKNYGYYLDEQIAVTLKGKEGKEKIAAVMDLLRRQKKDSLAGIPIKSIDDFQTGQKLHIQENRTSSIDLPRENVLRFSFMGGGFVMARPSGTEPKIRFYFCVKGDSYEQTAELLELVKKDFFIDIPLLEAGI